MNLAATAYQFGNSPYGRQVVSQMNGPNGLGTMATNVANRARSSFVSPIQYHSQQYSQEEPRTQPPQQQYPQQPHQPQQYPQASYQPQPLPQPSPQQNRFEHRNPYNYTDAEIAHDNRFYQRVKKGPPRNKLFIAALVVIFIFFLVFTILLFASGTSWIGIGGASTVIWMTASVMAFAVFKLFRTFQGTIPYKHWQATRHTRIGKTETMGIYNIPAVEKKKHALLKQILSSMAIGLAISSTYSTGAVLSK